MVVIYDRFVFFSVEKFFIPLLYSCLNILVQRSLRECMCMCGTFLCICMRGSVYVVCVGVCERGGSVAREKERERWDVRDGSDVEMCREREKGDLYL